MVAFVVVVGFGAAGFTLGIGVPVEAGAKARSLETTMLDVFDPLGFLVMVMLAPQKNRSYRNTALHYALPHPLVFGYVEHRLFLCSFELPNAFAL